MAAHPRWQTMTTNNAWNITALREGHTACFPRRTGDVCEHQGGEFNAFDYAYGLESSQRESEES